MSALFDSIGINQTNILSPIPMSPRPSSRLLGRPRRYSTSAAPPTAKRCASVVVPRRLRRSSRKGQCATLIAN